VKNDYIFKVFFVYYAMGSLNLRYSLILLMALLFLLPHTMTPIRILHLFVGGMLFYFIPGLFLVNRFFRVCNRISGYFLAIIMGMCFHICYLYFLSLFTIPFSLPVLLIPGILCTFLLDYQGVQLPPTDTSEFYLCAAALVFFLLTFTLSPGEDANGHLLLISETLEESMLPHTYSLYDEVSVSYHMGVHALTSELCYVSGLDGSSLLPSLGSVWAGFLMVTSYLCIRTIHGKRAGIIAGILVCFATLPPLHYLSYGAYASMVSFALQPLVILLLLNSQKVQDIPLISLVLAAGFMSHTSFILLWIPLFLLVTRYRMLIPACLLSLVFSIPHLIRLQPGYTPGESLQLMQLWFLPETFRIQMLAERIGILIVFCGAGGILFLKKREVSFFMAWIGSLGCIALLSIFPVSFPFQFIVLANRLVDFMFLPLALLSGVFLSRILKGKYIALSFLLIIPVLPHMYAVPRYSEEFTFYADCGDFATDQAGIMWLMENTPPDAVILNEWWTGTGSSWITSLAHRRLIFPYLYVHDHFLDTLSIAQRGREVLWIGLTPDSKRAHALLREWNVDYIFLSSSVEDRVRWRRDIWNVSQMISSPHYTMLFNEGETYIFRIESGPWNHARMLYWDHHRTDEHLLTESVSLQPLLLLTYHDAVLQPVEVKSDEGLMAEFLQLGTGENVSVFLPFDPSMNIVSPSSPNIESTTIVFPLPGHSHGPINLSWEWSIGTPYQLEEDGHLYTRGVHTLKITYLDQWPGNVDVNILVNGRWESLAVIDRRGDETVKELLLYLSGSPLPLDIGFYVHGGPFSVLTFEVID
jgi:hypothetical protein